MAIRNNGFSSGKRNISGDDDFPFISVRGDFLMSDDGVIFAVILFAIILSAMFLLFALCVSEEYKTKKSITISGWCDSKRIKSVESMRFLYEQNIISERELMRLYRKVQRIERGKERREIKGK